MIALLLVLLLTAGAGVGSWWWLSGRFTTVPAMASMNEAKAREALSANDLEVATASEYSETVPNGIIIRTDPTSGDRLLRGSSVTIVVSKGAERYPMPPVVGIPVEEASKAITDGRLSVGKVTEAWSDSKPAGEVLSASQDEGAQLKPDTAIDLTVSKGPEPIAIPDLTNTDAAAAQKQLKELGFEVVMREENSTKVEAGKIISQNPKGGDGKRGDSITIVKSLGPVMVEIPSVSYKSKDEAVKLLTDLDLEVKIERANNFPIPLDVAAGTDPGQGQRVPVGSTVTLFVA